VQVLADAHGNVVHLGERECTIQRRHQKLVEETPSPAVDEQLRARIGAIAVDAARAAGYRSAGTIEGLLSRDGEYYFLEMNTRIQVEHTVTEMVTGLDLVREQVFIAAGEPLSFRQEDVQLRGHAIECRINAEDPATGFLPSPGRITTYRQPAGPGVRVDSGVEEGLEVAGFYDPLIAKLVVHGVDREHARRRMIRALDEYEVGGVQTLLGFHRALMRHSCFVGAETCHGVVESKELAEQAVQLSHQTTIVAPQSDGRARAAVLPIELDGKRFEVRVLSEEPPHTALARARRERGPGHGSGEGAPDAVVSPMQGTILDVRVAEGDEVAAGDVVCIVEAMKMENEIAAHRPGVVSELAVAPGQPVSLGQVICVVDQGGDPGAD
jgi:acetyl-CoA/propionyl-CoA carboxylase biotin carboxyl carrier protein